MTEKPVVKRLSSHKPDAYSMPEVYNLVTAYHISSQPGSQPNNQHTFRSKYHHLQLVLGLTLLYFSVSGLDLLGQLHQLNQEATVAYIYSFQSTVDGHGGFYGYPKVHFDDPDLDKVGCGDLSGGSWPNIPEWWEEKC